MKRKSLILTSILLPLLASCEISYSHPITQEEAKGIISNTLNDVKKKDYSSLKYVSNQIFRRDYLFQTEGKYKGNTKRTTAGGVWLDGYSDHLPVVVYLAKEIK